MLNDGKASTSLYTKDTKKIGFFNTRVSEFAIKQIQKQKLNQCDRCVNQDPKAKICIDRLEPYNCGKFAGKMSEWVLV